MEALCSYKEPLSVTLAKGMVLAIIGAFVLYIPLGEPNYDNESGVAHTIAYGMSDISFTATEFSLRVAESTKNVFQYFVDTASDVLYEMKKMVFDGDLCDTLCSTSCESEDQTPAWDIVSSIKSKCNKNRKPQERSDDIF